MDKRLREATNLCEEIINSKRRVTEKLNLVPRAFPLKNGWDGKRPWHRLVTCTANLHATRWFWADRSRTEQKWKIIISRTVCQYFRVCAIQKLKIHLIVYYSNATSL